MRAAVEVNPRRGFRHNESQASCLTRQAAIPFGQVAHAGGTTAMSSVFLSDSKARFIRFDD
ncbi:MAG: hypothetical protein ACREIF_11085 [Chthoniobacterales bacterium]